MSKISIKKQDNFSPNVNPLIDPQEIPIKKRMVRSGLSEPLVNPETGEFKAAATVISVEYVDDEAFTKVFNKGVAEKTELKITARRVFDAIVEVYNQTEMKGGYADSVYLAWFDDSLSGHKLDMSEKTFNRGLKELLEKKFIYPRSPNLFWVNPTYFFRGNRAKFITEYVKERKDEFIPKKQKNLDGDSHKQMDIEDQIRNQG